MFRKRFLFVLFLFFWAFSVHAGVVITEIMYDLEGVDTGREWVEIQNIGAIADLTGWKFFESGTNHGLTLMQGSASISQNGFAVIADNTEKFLLDWPGFSGTIFDSSFSLSNTGETITLRDANLADTDSVSYLSDWGGVGDGKSLQKNDSQWVSALPIPGENNNETIVEQKIFPPLEGGAGEGRGDDGGNGSISPPPKASFSAYAGEDKSTLAGAEVYFLGQVKGVSDNLVDTVRFLWNFGDGTVGDGKNIKHIFQYPGNYIVNLDVSLGTNSDSDSLKVVVSEAGIYVSEIKPGGWVEIKNDSAKIADVSGFGLQVNDSKTFNFSKDTKLTGSSFLTLDSLILGFEIPDIGEIKILYSNGKILFSSKYETKNLSEKESISFDDDSLAGGWVKSKATPGVKNTLKKNINQINKIFSGEITPPPNPPPLIVRGGGEERDVNLSLGGGVTGGMGQASAISASFWSETKWLIFGIGGGVLVGIIYFLLKARFLTKTDSSIISNSRE